MDDNKELATLPEKTATDPQTTLLETVMRAAADPSVDPARLEKLLEIGRELQEDRAKAAFNHDFAELKKELPVIDKRGVVLNKRGGVQFKYARYDDLHEGITPLLTKYRFATSYSFEEPEKTRLKCILELTHGGGHSKFFHWTLPAAGENQYVTNLQNAAAARTFAKRCVLIDALDILTQEIDRDGAPVEAPERITEEEDRQIDDIVFACEQQQRGMTMRFKKWLKTEMKADQIRDLFKGAQQESVMRMLKKKMEDLKIP